MRALQAGELLLRGRLRVQVLLEGAVRGDGRPVVRLQLAQPHLQGLRLSLRVSHIRISPLCCRIQSNLYQPRGPQWGPQ